MRRARVSTRPRFDSQETQNPECFIPIRLALRPSPWPRGFPKPKCRPSKHYFTHAPSRQHLGAEESGQLRERDDPSMLDSHLNGVNQ